MEVPNSSFNTNSPLRESISSIVMKGYAILKIPVHVQTAMWKVLDSIDSVSPDLRRDFSFPEVTDGFLSVGGEYAKYTSSIDLCDRFCFWHKNREMHQGKEFANDEIYRAIKTCEMEMHAMAQQLISELWDFFNSPDPVNIRDSSYLQLCMYASQYHANDRGYLQDRHEDGHLITLIKPTRDGLVIFPGGPEDCEVPVFLRDDELLVITGSLLTAMSDGRIPPMYHAVKNPFVQMERKSVVYFAIPDLSQTYTTLLAKNPINVGELADESHRAFGNTALI
ncbi:hypothetical protein J2W23_000519 [Variovorax boronicumulans]|uniref:2OG-Fe(II) oxygenase family protein n=1 Tax=Variovorax boronicumulans TaxID=436515 RepID=UPI00278AF233|nr:2OG-Fe(II) oxygenase family protein [Variovorax boronicumulans]MDQ0012155.1 hypothetical protein [Variovorax boronicumulans]